MMSRMNGRKGLFRSSPARIGVPLSGLRSCLLLRIQAYLPGTIATLSSCICWGFLALRRIVKESDDCISDVFSFFRSNTVMVAEEESLSHDHVRVWKFSDFSIVDVFHGLATQPCSYSETLRGSSHRSRAS